MPEQHPLQNQFFESYEEFSDSVFKHCYFRVSDRDVALDLMQDTFAKTWAYVQKGNDVEDVKAFLFRVANNLIIDFYRKKKSVSLDRLVDNEEDSYEPSENGHMQMIAEAEVGQVMKALQSVEEPYRQAVTLRYVDGLSPKEISEIVGESPNNVSVRINRGLQKLHTVLGEHE